MLGYQRRERIRQLVATRQEVSVAELSQLLGASPSSIRRDLDRLEQEGLLQRRHGGALAHTTAQAAPEPPVLVRAGEQAEEKRRIGQAAAALVKDGETLFISGGTTTPEVARHLRGRQGLTVLTNALNIAHVLLDDPAITLVVVGGLVRRSEWSLVGPLAEQALRDLRADKVIMSIRAIHPTFGLTNDTLMETQTDRSIIACAPELIIVADHTKFGRVAPSLVAPVTAMHTLVTDRQAPAEVLAALRDLGIRIIQV